MLGLRSSLNTSQNLVDEIRACIANSRIESHGVQLELCSDIPDAKINNFVEMVILRVFQDCLRIILRLTCAQKILVNLDSKNMGTCTDSHDLKQLINLEIKVEVENKLAEINISENFKEVERYALAFGGEFTVDDSNDTRFNLKLSIDITDFMEENI